MFQSTAFFINLLKHITVSITIFETHADMLCEPRGIPTRDSSFRAVQALHSLNLEPLNSDASS
jgi:hypothetical protein